MKQKKEFKYYLKNDVRDDLENLVHRCNYLLTYDGFGTLPSYSILPALFKVFSHLLWNRKFETWFKKVYD